MQIPYDRCLVADLLVYDEFKEIHLFVSSGGAIMIYDNESY